MKIYDFSTYTHDLYDLALSSELDIEQIANIAVSKLNSLINFESAWYGWFEFDDEGVKLFTSDTINLPVDYYQKWFQISKEDVITRRLRSSNTYTVDYHHQQVEQTNGMIAFVNEFGLKSILTTINNASKENALFFISIYRHQSEYDWNDTEKALFHCSINHLVNAMRLSLFRQNYDKNNVGAIVYTSQSGETIIGKSMAKRRLSLTDLPSKLSLNNRGKQQNNFAKDYIVELINRQKNLNKILLRPKSDFDKLSKREKEVAIHLCQEGNYKLIAAILNISPTTVRNHTQKIYIKLNIQSRNDLIKIVYNHI